MKIILLGYNNTHFSNIAMLQKAKPDVPSSETSDTNIHFCKKPLKRKYAGTVKNTFNQLKRSFDTNFLM